MSEYSRLRVHVSFWKHGERLEDLEGFFGALRAVAVGSDPLEHKSADSLFFSPGAKR